MVSVPAISTLPAMVLPHGQRELRLALRAVVAFGPFRLPLQVVEQPEQQLLGRRVDLEYGLSVLVADAQHRAVSQCKSAQLRVAVHECQEEHYTGLLEASRITC